MPPAITSAGLTGRSRAWAISAITVAVIAPNMVEKISGKRALSAWTLSQKTSQVETMPRAAPVQVPPMNGTKQATNTPEKRTSKTAGNGLG